jgi:hypothetical protein
MYLPGWITRISLLRLRRGPEFAMYTSLAWANLNQKVSKSTEEYRSWRWGDGDYFSRSGGDPGWWKTRRCRTSTIFSHILSHVRQKPISARRFHTQDKPLGNIRDQNCNIDSALLQIAAPLFPRQLSIDRLFCPRCLECVANAVISIFFRTVGTCKALVRSLYDRTGQSPECKRPSSPAKRYSSEPYETVLYRR